MAYELAIEQGADIIEPDLVMSADGHLIVRHENEIGETTDIAERPEYAARKTVRDIDGLSVTGWFTEDFTLTELKSLRAKERLPHLRPQSAQYDGQDVILTFEEVLDIAAEATARIGRAIGVAPELKHPSHFNALGLPIEDRFIEVLERRGLTTADAHMLVQCFEVDTLERLSQRIRTPLLQLMQVAGGPVDRPDLTYQQMTTPEGLRAISRYAGWIGVQDTMIIPRDQAHATLPATSLITDAHTAGIKVVAWTFRAENCFLPYEHRSNESPPDHGDLTGFLKRFYALGVDAVFSDFPDLAVAALSRD